MRLSTTPYARTQYIQRGLYNSTWDPSDFNEHSRIERPPVINVMSLGALRLMEARRDACGCRRLMEYKMGVHGDVSFVLVFLRFTSLRALYAIDGPIDP